MVAIVFAAAALLTSLVVPGPRGPECPVAPGLAEAFVWGDALVVECTGVGALPERTVFRITSVNLGNRSAENTIALYTVYYGGPPVEPVRGSVSLGTIPRLTQGNTTGEFSRPCGQYGQQVEVAFEWQ